MKHYRAFARIHAVLTFCQINITRIWNCHFSYIPSLTLLNHLVNYGNLPFLHFTVRVCSKTISAKSEGSRPPTRCQQILALLQTTATLCQSVLAFNKPTPNPPFHHRAKIEAGSAQWVGAIGCPCPPRNPWER